MNALIEALALQSWKPALSALLLPPVPFLILLLLAAPLLWRKRGLGWMLVIASVSGLWFSQCESTGQGLARLLLRVPQPLNEDTLSALRKDVQARKNVSIAVLGSGTEAYAAEYGMANLSAPSMERLRYGLWLAKRTGASVGFTGGIPLGRSEPDDTAEAAVAARIATQDFGRNLQWLEPHAKDTQENASRSIGLLREAGVQKVLVVTHGWQMPRALKAFEASARGDIEIVAAPMGLGSTARSAAMRWLPSLDGGALVRQVLGEWLGTL